MNELKKCPFCGGEVRFVKTGCSSRGKIGYLFCDGCKERFFDNDKWHTELVVYEKWNTRKPLERVIERLEEKAKEYTNDDLSYRIPWFRIDEAIEIIKEELM